MNSSNNEYVRQVAEQKYEFGFTTDVQTEIIEKGLNEDVVRLISAKKGEPDWMLDFRLKAFRYWKDQREPTWGHVHVPPIDYQAISYYADPMAKRPKGDGKIDPELEKTFDKLGIPLEERLALSGNTAVDAIMDSVSVKTTFKEKLREKGVIFCSIGEAIKEHGDLVRQYLGTVVPYRDNFFAALNSAVFSDGSFVYIPKGVRCPMELSSYFRINARNTGQFERTLIVADDDSYVSYLEGCTAPMRDENQLHAAIVEIIVMDRAEVKYSTVQNWYPGDEQGRGGVLNLVTKRGDLRGEGSKLSWTQVETGSAITWKYPSCILRGTWGETPVLPLSRKVSRQAIHRTPIEDWCVQLPPLRMPATIRRATLCCWAATVELTPSLTWTSTIPRPSSSMRLPPARSQRTSSSTVTSAASPLSRP